MAHLLQTGMLICRRSMLALIASLLILPALHAQQGGVRQTIITRSTRAIKGTQPAVLAASHGIALNVDMAGFRKAAGPDLLIGSMPLAPGLSVDLDLHEYSIIAPDAKLTSTGPNGTTPLPPTTARLYRGKVAGNPGSDAYLAFSATGIVGLVTIDGKGYEIATDYGAKSTQSSIAAVSYPSSELGVNVVNCGVNEGNSAMLGGLTTDEMAKLMKPRSTVMSSAGTEILYSVTGAFDADHEYLGLFAGDKQAATDYMISTIGQVSAVYERDLSCQIVIGNMHLWETAGTDPYKESGVIQLALEEARTYWFTNNGGIDRGFTNVFSGKPWSGTIGVAYLGGLCYKNPAIGYCGITRNNPTLDTRVVAHETGHIFGSKHTHDCSWPGGAIDSCAAAEGGSCFSGSKQTLGTIMSYCNQSEFRFHQKCIDLIQGILAKGLPCIVLSRKLTVSPTVILFPPANLGTPQDTILKAFYRNDSKKDVTVLTQQITGTQTDQLVIPSVPPTFTLKPGESKDLEIKYLANSEVPTQAVMTITHDALNKPITVTIEAATADNQPLLSFTTSSKGEVDFGKERVGSKHDSTLPKIYTNLGHGLLHALNTEIVGPDRFDFQILEGTAPFDVEAQQFMPARIRFAPSSDGPKRAWLRVESNSKNSKVDSIPLKGEGTAGPRLVLKVNDLAVDYRDRERGKLYDTTFNQFFYNDGTDTMTLYAEVEGPDKDDFTFGSFGIAELAPGQSLDLTITFFVKATESDGQRQADLVITTYYHDEPIDTDRVNLLGRVGPPASVPWAAQRNAGISITPNPTAGDADLHVVPMPDEVGLKYTMRVTDAAGREVDLQKGTFSSDGISYRFWSGDLGSGVYYISVATLRGTRVGSMTIAR